MTNFIVLSHLILGCCIIYLDYCIVKLRKEIEEIKLIRKNLLIYQRELEDELAIKQTIIDGLENQVTILETERHNGS